MTPKTKTEEYLREVVLPQQTKSYTVIPHGEIIDLVRKVLEENGFIVSLELYKASDFGREAVGFMKISKEEDAEDLDVDMTFNWTNSYNKKLRFSCGIGGYIKENDTPFITSAKGSHWKRKHSGTALDEARETIEQIVVEANDSYEQILDMKRKFKDISLTRKQYAKLIGLLFFDKKVLFPEQVNIIRNEYDKPSYSYRHNETLWCLYQMIMQSVSEQVPSKWYQQQLRINSYIQLMYGTATEEDIVIINKDDVKELIEEGSVHTLVNLQNIHEAEENQVELTEMEMEGHVLSEEKITETQGLLIVDFSRETPVTVHSILPKKEIQTPLPTEPATEEEEAMCDNCGSTAVTFNSSHEMICDNCGHQEETVLDESDDEEFDIVEEDEELQDISIEEEEEEVTTEEEPTVDEKLKEMANSMKEQNPEQFKMLEEAGMKIEQELMFGDPIEDKLKIKISETHKIANPKITYKEDEEGIYYIVKIVETGEIVTIAKSQI